VIDQERLTAAFAPFGWTPSPPFWRYYHTNVWVFNLANAVVRLTAALGEAQAENERLRHVESAECIRPSPK
jgi:hypothetical protein